MAYLKPSFWIRRIVNPLAMRSPAKFATPLAVRRRRSGGTQRVPVTPIEHDGVRYLVCPRGETEWVRNLRAAGGNGELGGEPFTATEVPVAERPPILETYKKVAGKAVSGYFKKLPDPADHPVFRLSS